MSVVWAKHGSPHAISWCAVHSVADGSVRTMCSGRWNDSDEYSVHDDPPADERCGACEKNLLESVRIVEVVPGVKRRMSGGGTGGE